MDVNYSRSNLFLPPWEKIYSINNSKENLVRSVAKSCAQK